MDKLQPQDYERIGRAMEAVVTSGYTSKRRLIGASFLRGIFFGLGATIGVSIVLAIVLWVLTLFSDVPLIGNLLQKIENRIEDVQQQ